MSNISLPGEEKVLWQISPSQIATNQLHIHLLHSDSRHRCSNSHLEAAVSQTLSALLKRLTDLERHEADLRACQTNEKVSRWSEDMDISAANLV